jgi:uncharacterized protein with PIN domain
MSSPLDPGFEQAFRALLWRLRPAHLERGVLRLLSKLRETTTQGEDPQRAFAHLYDRVRRRVLRVLVRNRESYRRTRSPATAANLRAEEQTRVTLENLVPGGAITDSPDFHCDSGLGGLARWLRAAGYDARFWPYVDDDELIRETLESQAILLTTDRPLTERSAVVWGAIPALLVPLEVGKHEQFRFVAQRLGLRRKSSRCMTCGGQLQQVEKERVRDRIPPRTYPWRDDYFECTRCGKLFWHGTHWEKVDRALNEMQ